MSDAYRRKTLHFTLKERHKLQASENKMLGNYLDIKGATNEGNFGHDNSELTLFEVAYCYLDSEM